jgi:hypothetical protein
LADGPPITGVKPIMPKRPSAATIVVVLRM